MNITKEQVQEFIKICEEEHGVRMEEGWATVRLKEMLMLYELMHRRPPPKKEVDSTDPICPTCGKEHRQKSSRTT